MNNEIELLLTSIKKLENYIRNAFDCGIIEHDDVVLHDTMNTKLSTLKKKYVDKMHVSEDGTPRKISEMTTGGKHFYVTYCTRQKKVKSTTLDGLYEKLYLIYSDGVEEYSFEKMFKLAIEQKKKSKGITDETGYLNVSCENTIYRNEHDYMRFIEESFAKKDIRTLTPVAVKEYTISMLNRVNAQLGHKLPKKAFLNYKGILNMAFSYADEHDICENFIMNPCKFKNTDYRNLYDGSKKKAEQKAFSKDEIDMMDEEINIRIQNPVQYGICYTNGYMFKLSKLTGLRCAELCSLKKDDISFEKKYIHVHSQQLKRCGQQEYYYAQYTKDEKGDSKGGRFVPLLPEAEKLLLDMYQRQIQAGIVSEWVFANPDGSWIKSDTDYQKFLQRLSLKFNFSIKNNHAIRMYFNSFVLIPAGISVTDRAKILGHSPEVNLKNYSFEDRKYCEKALIALCNASS